MRRNFTVYAGVALLCGFVVASDVFGSPRAPSIRKTQTLTRRWPIVNLAVSADGARIVLNIAGDERTMTSSSYTVEMLDAVNFRTIWSVTPGDILFDPIFTPDSKYLVMGELRGYSRYADPHRKHNHLLILDAADGTTVSIMEFGQKIVPRNFAFSKNGEWLLFYAEDGICLAEKGGSDWRSLRVVSTHAQKPFSDLSGLQVRLVSDDGAQFMGPGGVYNAASRTIERRFNHNLAVFEGMISLVGEFMIFGEEEASREGFGLFQILDAFGHRLHSSTPVYNGGYVAGTLEKNGWWLALGDNAGQVTVFETKTWQCLWGPRRVLQSPIDALAFIPGKNTFLVAGEAAPMSGKGVLKVFKIKK